MRRPGFESPRDARSSRPIRRIVNSKSRFPFGLRLGANHPARYTVRRRPIANDLNESPRFCARFESTAIGSSLSPSGQLERNDFAVKYDCFYRAFGRRWRINQFPIDWAIRCAKGRARVGNNEVRRTRFHAPPWESFSSRSIPRIVSWLLFETNPFFLFEGESINRPSVLYFLPGYLSKKSYQFWIRFYLRGISPSWMNTERNSPTVLRGYAIEFSNFKRGIVSVMHSRRKNSPPMPRV